MRQHLEHRLQHKVPVWSSLMTWLVARAAEVICRYRIQSNGRTSYENVTGHKGLQPIAIFGERTMFKFTTDKNHRKKMESEWDYGFFLGVNPGTTEHLICPGDDVYSCATIRRLEEGKAFDPSVIKETKMRYREYVLEGDRSTPIEVRIPTASTPASVQEMPQPIPRRAKLTPGDFAQHGYTVGCPGCEQLQLGSSVRRSHTEECRKRIESELIQTSDGQEQLGRAKGRLDTRTAEIGQAIIDNENAEDDNAQEVPQNVIEENMDENNGSPEGAGGS